MKGFRLRTIVVTNVRADGLAICKLTKSPCKRIRVHPSRGKELWMLGGGR
jgi:hypothetical protein